MSGHVVLASWTDAHDAATVRWLNDPHIRATFGITSSPTLESHARWRLGQGGLSGFAILVDGRHVGNALLMRDMRHLSAYLQIYIGEPDCRGRGVGRAALAELLGMGFGHLGLHRIWLHTVPDNIAAERLYLSCGFVFEGLERDAVKVGSQYRSQKRWSLLAHEYSGRGSRTP